MSNQSFKVKSGLTLTPVDLTTLVNPQAGDLACDSNDSNKIKRYDALTSAWTEVGSGGVGSVDIMFVQDFESASLATFESPTDVTLSTTDPLHGKVSAILTHDASVNKSFKQIIPVDRKFRGQAMVLDLNVKSAASAGNVTIKITDESAPVDLIASEQLQLSNDVSGRRSSVSFTIPSTCASLSYTITALPEAGSPVTRIDDIVAMLSDVSLLETSVEVPNMTAWQGYTPTFQGFGTPSNVEFEWRQVGENVEIRGKFASGTTTAVEARIGLPGGLTSASTSLIPSIQPVGIYAGNITSTANAANDLTTLIEPSVSYVTFRSPGSALLTKANASQITTAGSAFSFFASVPCAGLSATTTKTIPLTQSGLVQEADGYYQLNNFTYRTASTATSILYFNDGTIVGNIGDHITKLSDSVNGDQFIATKSGIYNVTFSVEFGGTSGTCYLTKNSTTNSVSSILATAYEAGGSFVNNLAWSGYLQQGDILRFIKTGFVSTFPAADWNYLSIVYQGSLKQVSVSSDQKITIPTSELRFEGASSRGSTATAIVKFDTMAKLRGDAFTVESDAVLGTRIKMKKAGKLDVSASLYKSAAGMSISLTKNQTDLSNSAAVASEVLSYSSNLSTVNHTETLNWCGFVSIGDIIRVASNAVPTADLVNNLNLSFQEQDISVSVTNTLPQFSESDSSVRVDTANGYGSTSGNKIPRFSSVRDNIGSDIEYLDSATNGASFTAKSSGIYHVTYTNNTVNAFIGISKNADATDIITNILNIDTSKRLSVSYCANVAGYPEEVSWQGYLQAGDIIRPHNEGTTAATSASRTSFTISKVGKPNVTGVDVTPFVNVPQPEDEEVVLNTYAGYGSTNNKIPYFSSIAKNTNKGILRVENSSVTGNAIIALKNCKVRVIANFPVNSTLAGFTKNSTNLTTTINALSYPERIASAYISVGDLNQVVSFSWEGELKAGEIVRLHTDGQVPLATNRILMTVNATAASDQILTAPETFSTDTASLRYANASEYTLSTLQNAPVGTYITFTYAANTNTRTQTTLTNRPSQTDADMNVNGIQIFTRAYNAASTAAQPAAFAIQIGKGLKGKSLDLYKSAGKVTAGSLDLLQQSATVLLGVSFKEYNEVTGILYVDAGLNNLTSTTNSTLFFSDLTTQTSGYLVINASKNPALTGLNVLLPRIATLSDVKPSGTSGGSSTAGAYQTRTLNTISDPTSIVTSLSSNQFTLPAGTYYIEASAPCCASNTNKIKIRNITDSSDAILGSAVNNGGPASAFTVAVQSVLAGTITISTSKTFELQHRVTTSRATDGYGTACSFGDDEVYSIVKITKVK